MDTMKEVLKSLEICSELLDEYTNKTHSIEEKTKILESIQTILEGHFEDFDVCPGNCSRCPRKCEYYDPDHT